jgi:hypothetical protein
LFRTLLKERRSVLLPELSRIVTADFEKNRPREAAGILYDRFVDGLLQQPDRVVELAAGITLTSQSPEQLAQVVMGHDKFHVEQERLAVFAQRPLQIVLQLADQPAQEIDFSPQVIHGQSLLANLQCFRIAAFIGQNESFADQRTDVPGQMAEDCIIK